MSKNAAVLDVLAERIRQVKAEGWAAEHDDGHDKGELATVAACYALHASGFSSEAVMEIWPKPWSRLWFKPADQRRNLVKAGALILAEIERLDRLAAKKEPS